MKILNYTNEKTILLQGGIGNQIFQYVFGQYIKKKYGYKICYHFIDTNSKKADSRELEIDKIFDNIAIEKSIYLTIIQNLKLFKYALIKSNFLRRIFSTVIDDERNTLDPISIISHKYFIGYWIDLFYYENMNFTNDLYFKKNIISSDYSKIISEQIMQSKSSVSIHLRRGDYLNLSNLYYNLDIRYYTKSINFINNRVNSENTFFVFSDDIKFAKTMFKDLNVIFVENADNATEELFLMSRCDHNIIANSTFSLWGALLNQNKTKICISPDKWLKNKNFKTPIDSSFHLVKI
jgi:hypothetical protein